VIASLDFREWSRTPAMRAALAFFAASLVVLGWTFVRAFRAEPLPSTTVAPVTGLETIGRTPPRPAANLQTAVENDLFSPDRTAPATPYRMPGDADPGERRPEPARPAVLGTAVASDGKHFATLQLGTDSPKLVRVGDRIGDWTVRAISRGKVVVESSQGTRAELGAITLGR